MQNFINKSMRRATGMESKGPAPSSLSTARTNNAGGTSPQSHMEIGSKWAYSTLEYPADIQERSDLGHYMMFYVNVADDTRSIYSTYHAQQKKQRVGGDPLVTGGAEADQHGGLSDAQKALRNEQSHSSDAGKEGWTGGPNNVWQPGSKERVVKRKSFEGQIGERFGIPRTKRTTDSIVLYMPPTIQTNTNAAYKSSELGGLAMETGQRFMDFVGKADFSLGGNLGFNMQTLDAFIDAAPGWKDQGIRELEKGIAKAGSALLGGDAFTGLNKLHNRAENRYLEAAFDAVGFRKFSYTFKFTPKNVNESFVARDIIRTFRFHMSPELPETGDFGRYFITPAEFDLFYMFRGDENTWLNKITTCVLTNMDVNYANGRYQTFRPVWGPGNEGAPPTEIEMKLDFMETKVITKKEILEGY